MSKTRFSNWVAALALLAPFPLEAAPVTAADIQSYVAPYVATGNFSGAILAVRGDTPVYSRAYGFADRERRRPNRLGTCFHVASLSMQYTAAAVLRLVDAGKFGLDTPVSALVADYPNGANLTVRHLLMQTSGIADINARDDYDALLKVHQTPSSLVQAMRDVPALRAPGTFEGEEHSAYNLLALIVEQQSGLPFARAVDRLVFKPLGMAGSRIDDDSRAGPNEAIGYRPKGSFELERAPAIHWSAKAGNGSACVTVGDQLKFVRGVLGKRFLSEQSRASMFDVGSLVGYGWFRSKKSARFGQTVYSMNGRAPGFASAIAYVPAERLFVVAFSNIYASVPTDIAYDVTAAILGVPYKTLALQRRADPSALKGLPAAFHFGPDFYQPSATVKVASGRDGVTLKWPTGDISALIPVAPDRYIDRSYWVPVEVRRNGHGDIIALQYDRFTGDRLSS